MLSSTLSLAYLASGRIGAYLLLELSSPVHAAAGALLSAEAGAIVTDRYGSPWTVACPSILAAAGRDPRRDPGADPRDHPDSLPAWTRRRSP